MKKRPIFKDLLKRIKEPRKFIQILLGPRQVGKTTLALQLEKELSISSFYATADIATLEDLSWLQKNWEIARKKMHLKKEGLFIIDEVQKISHWSSMVKKLWDEDTKNGLNLKVIILGSSPWLIQKGISESLTGRFEILPIFHWSFKEMKNFFHGDLDKFIYFGGYPGAASFVNDFQRWLNYINDSLIETTISRDILLMTKINKPILLRRLFQLGCSYSSQILSYQKMLGQLQDVGNTTTLAHYLNLLSGAGMITGLNKYANQDIRSKLSSPKLQVYNTALMSACSKRSFSEAKADKEFWGRLVESAVGAHLLNGIKGTRMELYYWREKNMEIDFVLKRARDLIAIEVKSSYKNIRNFAMDAFFKAYSSNKKVKMILIGENGISLKNFFNMSIEDLF